MPKKVYYNRFLSYYKQKNIKKNGMRITSQIKTEPHATGKDSQRITESDNLGGKHFEASISNFRYGSVLKS